MISERHWKPTNYFGDLLSREWPIGRINFPLEKLTLEELREEIQSLKNRMADCKSQMKASEEALRNLQPGTTRHSYHIGVIHGLTEVIPNLDEQLTRAEQLLAAKSK